MGNGDDMSSSTPRPVSWLVVEPGWRVASSDREQVGTVAQVLGDADDDIFHGLEVSTGVLSGRRFVDAAQVEGIVEGEVRLSVTRDAFEASPTEQPRSWIPRLSL
jgi:hypothetical protein